MAWTNPKYWGVGTMVTAALLNIHIRDNLLALSTHAHGGAAGAGNDELSGLDFITMDDLAGNPTLAGKLQRNGDNLIWGASDYIITNEDPVAATPGLRTLGAGAAQASAGNHTH